MTPSAESSSTEPSRKPWHLVRDVLLAFYAMAAAPVLLLALTLLWHAETGAGRGFAVLVLLALPLPFVLMLCLRWPKRRKFRLISLALTVGIPMVLYLILAATTPTGRPIEKACVGSVFLNGGPIRWTPSGLVPEIDQVKLGIVLSPYYDALMSTSKADRLLSSAMPIYREMRERPEYAALGSALGYSYAELYGGRYDVGHFYYVVPPHKDGKRLPMVVFLHGSGGNMKAYSYIWEAVAARLQCVVICPSYGFGNWGPGATEAVNRAQSWALANLPVDPKHICLAGLSNGGLGVCRVAAHQPDAYRGLIFISPVLDKAALASQAFQEGCRNMPVLCITGAQDERVPREYVETGMRLAPNADQNVTLHIYDQEDHFLFFTARSQIEDDLAAWSLQLHLDSPFPPIEEKSRYQ